MIEDRVKFDCVMATSWHQCRHQCRTGCYEAPRSSPTSLSVPRTPLAIPAPTTPTSCSPTPTATGHVLRSATAPSRSYTRATVGELRGGAATGSGEGGGAEVAWGPAGRHRLVAGAALGVVTEQGCADRGVQQVRCVRDGFQKGKDDKYAWELCIFCIKKIKTFDTGVLSLNFFIMNS